jgi:hypothetical protein
MRLLLIHSDYIEYEAKKKTKMAEECSVLTDREEEALTVFCAVESIDEEDLEGVVLQGIEEIKKTAGQVNVKKVMIYPYAHLSSDLSSPETAITVPASKPRDLPSSVPRSAGTSPSSSRARATPSPSFPRPLFPVRQPSNRQRRKSPTTGL